LFYIGFHVLLVPYLFFAKQNLNIHAHTLTHIAHKQTQSNTTIMSQTRLLQSECAKNIQKAAINQVVTELVAAQKGLLVEKKGHSKNQDYVLQFCCLKNLEVLSPKLHRNRALNR
jgi:hypothetical protein